jgi:hypothetical protein
MLRTLIVAFVLLAPTMARCGEVLDRMAATVNGHALLQSDIEDELRYEFFAAKRPLGDASADDQKAALDRLVDQELLREQMHSRDFQPVAPEQVSKTFETFKSDYGASPDWAAALMHYDLSEADIRSHIETELNQLRLIDLRLRPTIQIDAASIRDYYQQQLLPKLPPGQHLSLQEATPTIRELLIQQKINDSLGSWLEALRAQAQIQRFVTGDQAK